MADSCEEQGKQKKKGMRKKLGSRMYSMPRVSFRRKSEPIPEEEEEEGGGGGGGGVNEDDVENSGKAAKLEIDRGEEEAERDVDKASCLSWVFLSWISSLIQVGFKHKMIEEKDLWKLRPKDDPEILLPQLMENLEKYRTKDGQDYIPYAIWYALARQFKWKLVVGGFFEALFAISRFVGPVLLRELVLFISEEDKTSNLNGYLLGFGLFLGQVVGTLCQSHSRFISVCIGLRTKNELTLSVFQHLLHLDQTGKQQLVGGQVMNLVSTDAQMALEFMRMFNRIWTAPFVLVAGIVYIYFYIGLSVFAGVLAMLLFVPVSIKFGKVQTKLQREKMKQSDKRVKLVSEMLSGIKVIKLNGWEKPLLSLLENLRKIEMKAIAKLHYYRGLTLPLALAIPNAASVVSFGVYILLGNEITPANTFAVVSAFVIIRSPFVTLPLSITMTTRAIVSASRFQRFLALKTRKDGVDPTVAFLETGHHDTSEPRSALEMRPLQEEGVATSFRMTGDDDDDDDNNVDGPSSPAGGEKAQVVPSADESETKEEQEVQQEPRVIVKNADEGNDIANENNDDIIVELKNASFKWSINPNDTNEENKGPFGLNNLELNVKRGQLVAVIGRLGQGKSSLLSALVGDMQVEQGSVDIRGSIGLCTQEAFIMNRTVRDNILFELPFETEKYNKTIQACALTSDLEMLPSGDLCEVGEKGVTISGGQKARVSLARAVYADADVYLLDDVLSAVDAHVSKHLFEKCISNNQDSILRSKTRIFVTHQLHLLSQVDHIVVMDGGSIVDQGSFDEIMQRGSDLIKSIQETQEENKEIKEQEETLKDRIDQENEPNDKKATTTAEEAPKMIKQDSLQVESKAKQKGRLVEDEKREKGKVDFRIISEYWIAGAGSAIGAICVLLSFVFVEAVFLSIDSWLAVYSQDENESISTRNFLIVYFSLTIAYFLVLLARALVYAGFSIRACRILYHRLQQNVFQLPMSFFWTTPLGRTVNRVTKDTSDIDTMLPQNMQWLIMTSARVLGVLVIITWSEPMFLVAIIPFLLIYLSIREYYRAAAVAVQRIESVLRSPVFSHLSETLGGATSIRAFGRTKTWLESAKMKVATNHRGLFAVEAIQVWLSMRLEFLGAAIVWATAISVVDTDNPGVAGLALSYGLNIIINLNMSVQQAIMVEQRMNAVERVLEYTELPNETTREPVDVKSPAPEWPQKGLVEFQDVSLRYRENLDPALNGISFRVEPGERIGIVGRTGSGKSSLTVGLLNLHPIFAGRIMIDGVNIHSMPAQVLRRSLSTIPQDPVLFSTSLRKNIDVFSEYTDAQVWDSIRKAHLTQTVEKLPDGLESFIEQGGENLSLGERQLVAIARALLRKARVVVIDEGTANVDLETDALIQDSIRQYFPDSTMLIIAHRLDIFDLDKILVMDAGTVGEYGPVQELLEKPDGMLRSLVDASSSSKES